MKRLSAGALGVGLVLFAGSLAYADLFKDGETVCFLGDSITARGSTQTVVSDYYLTRFPERTVRFVNAGAPAIRPAGRSDAYRRT